MTDNSAFRCGYVGICGRPNVGKSTLLNRLMGQKLSITSRKPHTTRWHILGIHTLPDVQIIYMDMPGLRQQRGNALNRFMHREVADGILTVDTTIMVIEALRWGDEDDYVLQQIQHSSAPIFAVINKIDKIGDKEKLLPFIDLISNKYNFSAVLPISARHDSAVSLEQYLIPVLPEQQALFPEDQLSDRNERFFIAELLREQLIRQLGDELPYCLTVVIENMRVEDDLAHIHALIWVENPGQKAIVIGENGYRLKQVGIKARLNMEKFLGKRVNLQTWVRIRERWMDDSKSIREFGYDK